MTTDAECPAHWALAQERVHHRIVLNGDGWRYGRSFAQFWNKGEPFIHLEHDIVPWPGAIQELIDCPEPWCVFESAYLGKTMIGFGIGKYRPEGRAPKEWSVTDWRCLDGVIVRDLRERFGPECIHNPPVAHARREPS